MQQMAAPLLIIMILAMMVLPLPPIALDLLFTFNIAMSMLVMLVALYVFEAAGLLAVPHRPAADDAVAPVAQRRIHARGADARA